MSETAPFGYDSDGEIIEFYKCEESICNKYVRGTAHDNNCVINYGCVGMSFCKEHYRISWAEHPENLFGHNYVGVICSICGKADHINWIKKTSKNGHDNEDRHISYCGDCNTVVCKKCCKYTDNDIFCPDCFNPIIAVNLCCTKNCPNIIDIYDNEHDRTQGVMLEDGDIFCMDCAKKYNYKNFDD